jgi:HNH endonuclease
MSRALREKIREQKKADSLFAHLFQKGIVFGPLPRKRYYAYDIIREYSLEEILTVIPETSTRNVELKVLLPGYDNPVTVGSERLIMYKTKGCDCVKCGRKGHTWRLERNHGNGAHLNLYTVDGYMMTKDHIHPKSRGGLNCLENYQPMCDSCNLAKANIVAGVA